MMKVIPETGERNDFKKILMRLEIVRRCLRCGFANTSGLKCLRCSGDTVKDYALVLTVWEAQPHYRWMYT